MNASVVMPTYNKRPLLARTLESLMQQKNAPEFEVIVVDDGSADDTRDYVEALATDYPLRYLRNPVNQGRSRTRNAGLEAARGAVIIFLDDDRVVCEDFVYQHVRSAGPGKATLGNRWEPYHEIETYLSTLIRPATGAQPVPEIRHSPTHSFLQPRLSAELLRPLQPEPGPLASKAIGLAAAPEGYRYQLDDVIWQTKTFQWPLSGDAPLAWVNVITGNFSAWRRDISKIGGFDERFSGWGIEDVEFGYRLAKVVKTFLYQPKAENFHCLHPKSPSHHEEQYNNWCYFYRKHPERSVGLYMPYTLGLLPFWAYFVEVTRSSPAPESCFGDEELHALRSLCALVDAVGRDSDMVLSLLPDVTLNNERSDRLLVSRPVWPVALCCIAEAKSLLVQFDGHRRLSCAIEQARKAQPLSTLTAADFKKIAASFAMRGFVREARPEALDISPGDQAVSSQVRFEST